MLRRRAGEYRAVGLVGTQVSIYCRIRAVGDTRRGLSSSSYLAAAFSKRSSRFKLTKQNGQRRSLQIAASSTLSFRGLSFELRQSDESPKSRFAERFTGYERATKEVASVKK